MLSWKSGTKTVFHFAINFKGSIQSNGFHQDIHIRMSAYSVLTSLSPTAFPCPSPLQFFLPLSPSVFLLHVLYYFIP